MGWLRRIREGAPREAGPGEGGDLVAGGDGDDRAGRASRAAPGLAATLEGLGRDAGHTILDLGHGTRSHLRLYGRFSRRIRFAGLLPLPPRGAEFPATLEALKGDPADPFDLVLAWNVLDWLSAEHRAALVERLDRITAPACRLYAVVAPSDGATVRPVRFTPADEDRVAEEPAGRGLPRAGPPLLPARVDDVLAPFEIRRAFTLRSGQREYAAAKVRAPP